MGSKTEISGAMKKHEGGFHQGPDRTAPYPVSRMAPATELVDLAKEIAAADTMLSSVATGKLKILAEQMRALQAQAQQVLESTQRNQRLHRAHCNFKRQPGKIYHLYRKEDGNEYFSMLSPDEWRGQAPHPYAGSYRLEADQSWTDLAELQKPDQDTALLLRLLDQ